MRTLADLGECPLWDGEASELVWIDMTGHDLHRSSLDGSDRVTHVDSFLGAISPRAGGGLLAATRQGFAITDPSGQLEHRTTVLSGQQRMNDGKCDSRGRFWVGSTDANYERGRGKLHLLHPDWRDEVVLDGLTLPNGLGWSPDDRTFYLADSLEGVLWAFDFDTRAGTISDKRALHTFDLDGGLPDGLCVDQSGQLWVARWGGAKLTVLDPDGAVVQEVSLPAKQASSCAFGGPDLDLLFVTSARQGLDRAADALDGSLYCVRDTGTAGYPPTSFGG